MPLVIPLTYYFLLPPSSDFSYSTAPPGYEGLQSPPAALGLPYTPLAASEDQIGEEEGVLTSGPRSGVHLSAADKWRLVKPLLLKYMLPLCMCLSNDN
jgi:battenin